MTSQPTDLNAPWSLHFDRDGTEDIAIIRDADGYDLARSDTFWMPEENDHIPATLAAMRLMVCAPKLLEALIAASDWIDAQVGKARTEVQAEVHQAIAEATVKRSTPTLLAKTGEPTPFDGYEIHGVASRGDEQATFYEPVDDAEAEMWTLFGHIPGKGLEAVGDFNTRSHAEEIVARITGRRYSRASTSNSGNGHRERGREGSMTDTFIELTEDEFDHRYPLVPNHINPSVGWAIGDAGGCLFETYGEEFAFIKRQDPRRVWTLVDGDDGDMYVISGLHFVNRIGYLLSTIPVSEDATIQVHLPMSQDEDDDEPEPEES